MNLAQIARILAWFALFFAAVSAVPLAVAWVADRAPDAAIDPVAGFTTSVVAGLVLAGVLFALGRGAGQDFFRREALTVVGFAWIIAGALGGTPLWASGALDSAADAFFESVSGLTTTGATVFGATNAPAIEDLPYSILLWRSLLQWIGGTGVILVFTLLLPALGLGGKNLLDSEAVGVSLEDQRPRMQEQARLLFRLYVGLTVACGLGYWACGLSGFDALCHALTTMATGGFSTRNLSLGAYDNVALECVAIVFMFLAGVNFALMLSSLRRRVDLRLLGANPEFRTYCLLVGILVAAVTATLWIWGEPMADPALGITHDYGDPLRCLRDSAFQVVSLLTSTGFGSCDFQNWPKVATYLLIVCMFIGGCTGSTAGGLKVYRALVCRRLVGFTLRGFINPRAVQKLRIGDDVLPDNLIRSVLTLLLLWILFAGLGTVVVGLDSRLDPMSAFSTSVSMLGCTGPAITQVLPEPGGFALANEGGINVGPYGGYGDLMGYTKVYLAFQMMLGRLEILAPLVLVFPSFWRK